MKFRQWTKHYVGKLSDTALAYIHQVGRPIGGELENPRAQGWRIRAAKTNARIELVKPTHSAPTVKARPPLRRSG